jgi:hypothetical protein
MPVTVTTGPVVGDTVAMVASEELQVPPATVSVNTVVVPGHIVVVPKMMLVDGAGITLTEMVTLVGPHALVTE